MLSIIIEAMLLKQFPPRTELKNSLSFVGLFSVSRMTPKQYLHYQLKLTKEYETMLIEYYGEIAKFQIFDHTRICDLNVQQFRKIEKIINLCLLQQQTDAQENLGILDDEVPIQNEPKFKKKDKDLKDHGKIGVHE